MKKVGFLFVLAVLAIRLAAQNNPPWQQPLMLARSTNGMVFSTSEVFQDSAGVPSALQWKGDTLIAVFQWFHQPVNSPTWDRVAVRFSYDKGRNWTPATPIIVQGLPAKFQRPFDPTLALLPNGRLRLYFSSSNGTPPMGPDGSVNTYSAVSSDGIHYDFEPGARVDHPDNRLIDPAVIYFNHNWHYTAPVGAPQLGAFHYISDDGVNFNQVINIMSNAQHNWTGNYVVIQPDELRFYGSAMGNIWFNKSTDGNAWAGYIPTNVNGGDPTVVRLAGNDYLMIYVGEPYTTASLDAQPPSTGFDLATNIWGTTLFVHAQDDSNMAETTYSVFNSEGKLLKSGVFNSSAEIGIADVADTILFLRFITDGKVFVQKMVVKR